MQYLTNSASLCGSNDSEFNYQTTRQKCAPANSRLQVLRVLAQASFLDFFLYHHFSKRLKLGRISYESLTSPNQSYIARFLFESLVATILDVYILSPILE